jgi:hypothetical protein
LPDESNSDEASSLSCSAYTQPSAVDDFMIEAEGYENEEEDEEEILTKKRLMKTKNIMKKKLKQLP